jgi:hypothetical protein
MSSSRGSIRAKQQVETEQSSCHLGRPTADQ